MEHNILQDITFQTRTCVFCVSDAYYIRKHNTRTDPFIHSIGTREKVKLWNIKFWFSPTSLADYTTRNSIVCNVISEPRRSFPAFRRNELPPSPGLNGNQRKWTRKLRTEDGYLHRHCGGNFKSYTIPSWENRSLNDTKWRSVHVNLLAWRTLTN